MSVPVIMDIIVGVVLLAFLAVGARRGLFESLAGLVIILAALVCAGMAASKLTPPVAKYIQPWIEKRVEARVDAALSGGGSGSASAEGSSSVKMPESSGSASSGDTEESTDGMRQKLETQQMLKLLGLDDDPLQSMTDSVQEKVRETGVSTVTAVAESMAESLIHMLLFVLSFALVLLVLKLLMHAINLVLRLPGLHLMNSLGGAAIGLVEGGLCLFLAIWVLRRFGVSFETENVSKTVLLHFFTTNTPLSALTFLQL